jgi:hypothetical protein
MPLLVRRLKRSQQQKAAGLIPGGFFLTPDLIDAKRSEPVSRNQLIWISYLKDSQPVIGVKVPG